jgi:hypothetical protein
LPGLALNRDPESSPKKTFDFARFVGGQKLNYNTEKEMLKFEIVKRCVYIKYVKVM